MFDNEYQRVQTFCLLFISAAIASYLAYWLRPVLLPFVVAVFIVSGLSPILDWLQRSLNTDRLMASVIAFLAGCLLVALIVTMLWASVADLASHSGAYQKQVVKFIDWVENTIPMMEAEGGASAQQVEQFFVRTLKSSVLKLSQTFLELISVSLIVLIYVFFLLLGTPTESARPRVLKDIDGQIRSYLSLKTLISLVTGAAFGLVLWLFGVPMAIAFGMMAFLLNFIPNIGPVIASMLPFPLIILHPDATFLWIATVVSLCVAIQFISGNVIEPRMMGQQADLHPIVVLLALMFWGMMWGMVGMFLATPITAAIRLALAQFNQTKSAAEIMAGRWPKRTVQEDNTVPV